MGFPGDSMVKNPSASARDAGTTGLIPVSERYPGGGNGNPLQYSCLGNSMDRGAWSQRVGHNRATEHIHTKYIQLIPGQRDFELHGFTILHRMQHLNSWFQHVGSSPLTRGRTWTPCPGSGMLATGEVQGNPPTIVLKSAVSIR